jgi:hypothetical protein
VTYGVTLSGGLLAAIDPSTVALVAAVLSFAGAIIVALIDTHSHRRADPTTTVLVDALAASQRENARLEAALLEFRGTPPPPEPPPRTRHRA